MKRMTAEDVQRLLGDRLGAPPCNGCRRCCVGDLVRVLPEEDSARWRTVSHPYFAGQQMLAHKPNGECVYLDDNGCSIHGTAPQLCSEMDCRLIAAVIPRTKARKLGPRMEAVWRKGRELWKIVA